MLKSVVPYEGFSSPDGLALLEGLQLRLSELKEETDSVPELLDPNTVPDEWLDYLGVCLGFHNFWLTMRDPAVKRELLKISRLCLIMKGTEYLLLKVIKAVTGFDVSLWNQVGPFIVGVNVLGEPLGSVTTLNSYLRLPINIVRGRFLWSEVNLAIANYGFIGTRITPVYDQFYLNVSVVGEPIF